MWSKIANAIKTALTLVAGFGQLKQGNTIVQKVTDFLTEITDAIADVERIHDAVGDATLTSEQKLQAAASLIGDALLKHPGLEGHKVQNPELFKKAVLGFAQAGFDFQSSLSADGVETVDKAA